MRATFDFLYGGGLRSSPLDNGASLRDWQDWAATFGPSIVRLWLPGEINNISIGAAAPNTGTW